MSAALVLAVVEEEDLSTGPIGLVIILLMLAATFFLIRNMNARIKRLPREFPGQDAARGQGEEPKDAP